MVMSHFGEIHPDADQWIRLLARAGARRRGNAPHAYERQLRSRLGAEIARRAARMSQATFTQDPSDGVNIGTIIGSEDHEGFDLTHANTPNIDPSLIDMAETATAEEHTDGRDATASHDSISRESVLPSAFGSLTISTKGENEKRRNNGASAGGVKVEYQAETRKVGHTGEGNNRDSGTMRTAALSPPKTVPAEVVPPCFSCRLETPLYIPVGLPLTRCGPELHGPSSSEIPLGEDTPETSPRK